MDVSDWLSDFLRRHRIRFRPFDWPEAGSDEELIFARLWLRTFEQNRVGEGEADDASESLGETPPKYRQDHLPAVMRAVRAARGEKPAGLKIHEPEPRRLPPAPADSPLRKFYEKAHARAGN